MPTAACGRRPPESADPGGTTEPAEPKISRAYSAICRT
jgi:hypothetical protein